MNTKIRLSSLAAAAALAASVTLGSGLLPSNPAGAQTAGSSAQVLEAGPSPISKAPIAIRSFSNSLQSSTTIGGPSNGVTAGRLTFGSAKFVKTVDGASAGWYRYAAGGTQIPKLEIKRGDTTYRFGTVVVTGIEITGDDAPDVETVTVMYGSLEMVNGAERTCWSQIANKAC